MEDEPRAIRVEFGGVEIARTSRAKAVLETSHPPTFYIPRGDIAADALTAVAGRTSVCEWKGRARYFDVVAGEAIAESAAFCYDEPVARFAAIAGYVAMYAAAMDACWVGDARVEPQPGGFYSGWITPDVVGPFKGVPGSMGW